MNIGRGPMKSPHLFDFGQKFDGVVVRRWIFLQLSVQTIPECFVHDVLHSALQTTRGGRRGTVTSTEKTAQRTVCVHVTSPSLRELWGFDLKLLVDYYLMSQSHVGDSFRRLHQLLHRDKPGWAGCEQRDVTSDEDPPQAKHLAFHIRHQ